jgi:D-aminopeptidase
LKRVVKRAALGIAKNGGIGGNSSGDIFIAFSTANPNAARDGSLATLKMLPNDAINPIFAATVQATEEAIINAMIAAETMTGINGNTVYALPHDRLKEVMKKYNRLQ